MQVMKVQGSRTLELFRAITVLVFPTDTSKAKAMAKTCKPGRERGGESEAMGLSPLVPFGTPGCHGRSKGACPQPQNGSVTEGTCSCRNWGWVTHRDSAGSKGTRISPRIKRANESPDLHVIHRPPARPSRGRKKPKQSRALFFRRELSSN